MVVADDDWFRETRSAISGARDCNMPEASGQDLAPAGVQRPIRRNSKRCLATRAHLRCDPSIGGESATTVGGVAEVKFAIALHVMSVGLHRGHGSVYVALVEPGSVKTSIAGHGERVHSVSARSLVVVNF